MGNSTKIIIKYIDLFGTRFTFYSEKMPKLYTVTGGIFSIISILACIFIFITFSFDDLQRKSPYTTMSSIPSEGYRKIKFGKEKIWIPWRIVDYNNNEFINHTGILYPIIYYFYGTKNKNTKNFNLTKKILNYKLCNETSMIYENNIYQITVPLNELYCIDMEDLEIGGSWITEFMNYIKFDLYYCEDGINYNETNSKCSSFSKIINFIGDNNSLEMELYYPVVQFQSTNKTFPVIVIYRNHFYHISKYVNKIKRIFLQENVLTDDSGWILKKEFNSSYWGLSSITGDTYYNGNEKDLMNEGSNSRAFSFNIYLEPGIIHYKRNYKKLHTIISDFFPIAYIIFIIMKKISKIFKNVESNKKMIELLFENLKEKPNKFESNLHKLTKKKNIKYNGRFSYNDLSYKKVNYLKKSKFGLSLKQLSNKNNNIHHPSLVLNNNEIHNHYNINSNRISKKLSSNFSKKNLNSKFYEKHKKSVYNDASNQNLIFYDCVNQENNYPEKIKLHENVNSSSLNKERSFIKQKLFPYKYYFFSIFIKNLDTSKKNCFISSRFAKIYEFLCQLFDITTYILLQREFNAIKKIFNEKNVKLIEKNDKININSKSFINNISDCIEEHKFYILAQGIKK